MSSIQIKGHERPINILLNSLKNNSLAGSYLFVGPEAIGKSLVAKYFAQVLNCEKNNFEACGVCSSCKKIKNLNHSDIHWITGVCSSCKKYKEKPPNYHNEYWFAQNCDSCDRRQTASNALEHMVSGNGSRSVRLRQIQILQEQINLRPFEGRLKVFVILDAQNLTEEAANCLLKILEEPPANSLIILTTSQIKRIFPTIASRCQKINFRALSAAELESILIKDYNFSNDVSRYLSFACEGRLGKSLGFNNPNILREKNQIIDNFVNLSRLGYFEEQIFEDKAKQKQLLMILLQWFRDIMILKAGIDKSSLINLDRKDDLLKLKDKYLLDEILNALKSIIRTNALLDQNLNVKISLSLLRERLCKG